jgi:lipoprotein-releasing system permease protein
LTTLRFPLFIAFRYFRSKKKRNVINIITLISMLGMGVGALALIIVLSAFNGINALVEDMYSTFDADLRIEPQKGKTFELNGSILEGIKQIEEIEQVNKVLEETVMLRFGENQTFATIKGVEESFLKMSSMDSLLWFGEPILFAPDSTPRILVGYMIAERLNLYARSSFVPLNVYAAKSEASNLIQYENAFRVEKIIPSGIFAVNVDIDAKYAVAPLSFVGKLLKRENHVSAIEFQLLQGAKEKDVISKLEVIFPEVEFLIRTRYQQNELLYKANNSEKWATFLILSFILLIATFNIIGSITILFLDKKKDVSVLLSMGTSKQDIRSIFFIEGLLISTVGGLIGLFLGVLIVFLQGQFGFIKVQGLLVDSYPVLLLANDLFLIIGLVLLIGILASWIPVRLLTRKLYFSLV